MSEKCDWCGREVNYKLYSRGMPDEDYVMLCAECILKGDGREEDLTAVGR